MVGSRKTVVACLLGLLLALALAACGGGGSDSSASTATGAGGASGSEGKTGHAGSEERQRGSDSEESTGESGGEAERFVPKSHHDSGGGAAQFRVKGGDNSVQEFGSEASETEFRRAAAALHAFLDARAAGAWATACRYLAKSSIEALKQFAGQGGKSKPNCVSALKAVTNPAAKKSLIEEAEQVDVGSLRTEGDQAFLIYRGLKDTTMAISVVKEGDAWKVASLIGTPLS